jgi:uncharacterized protein
MIVFEWDEAKAKINERKHGVSFEDAIQVFDDPYALFREDPMGSDEPRWQAIGSAAGITILFVVHTVTAAREGDEVIRLISARRVTRKERAVYDENRT